MSIQKLLREVEESKKIYVNESRLNALLESYEELLAALKRIEEYGHGIGHGSGYTCANIAEQAITNAEKLK